MEGVECDMEGVGLKCVRESEGVRVCSIGIGVFFVWIFYCARENVE